MAMKLLHSSEFSYHSIPILNRISNGSLPLVDHKVTTFVVGEAEYCTIFLEANDDDKSLLNCPEINHTVNS